MSTWKFVKYRALPTLAGGLVLALFAIGIARILFLVESSAGWICTSTSARAAAGAEFPANALCWATPFDVEEGVRYRVTLRMSEPWQDGGIAAGLNGVRHDNVTTAMDAGTLLRRHVTQPWMRPIARIGETGTDEYVLTGVDPADPTRLVHEFVARRSGRLYLFVNDAVTPLPGWQPFYRNNRGTASLELTRLGA